MFSLKRRSPACAQPCCPEGPAAKRSQVSPCQALCPCQPGRRQGQKPKKRSRGGYLSYMLMLGFYYGAMAFFSGLISVYLLDRGYTSTQVSFVSSSALLSSILLQPMVGAFVDRFPGHAIPGAALMLAACSGVLFILSDDLWSITLTYSAAVAVINSVNPVVERSATRSRHPYRLVRIWGTIGYAVCAQLGGVLYRYLSPACMFWGAILSLVLCVIGLLGTEDAAGPAPQPALKKGACAAGGRLWSRPFAIYLLLACLSTGITNVSHTYLPAMFQSEGIPVDMVSTILFVVTMAEIPLIFFSHKFMDRFSVAQLLAAVFLALTAQYGVYALVPTPAVQVLVAFLTKSTAGMSLIMINLKAVAAFVSEEKQITGLSVAAVSRNMGSVLFQMGGGVILDQFSFSTFNLILMACSCTGLALCAFSRLPRGRQLQMFS